MNKLDRDGREPLDLLQELEEVLGIASYPMNWPIGMGKAFEGLYDLYNQRLELYKGDERFASLEAVSYTHLDVYKRQYLILTARIIIKTARFQIPISLCHPAEIP